MKINEKTKLALNLHIIKHDEIKQKNIKKMLPSSYNEAENMNKLFLSAPIFLALSLPVFSFAATKSITVDWSMSDTTNVQSYKMYYSYSSDMTGKVLITTCAPWTEPTPNNFTMTCDNVTISSYPIYFIVTALTTEGDEINSATESVVASVSAVSDFALINPAATPVTLPADETTDDIQQPFAHLKLDTPGIDVNFGKVYDEISKTWIGTGAETVEFVTDGDKKCIKSNSSSDKLNIPVNNIFGTNQFSITFDYKVTSDSNQTALYFFNGGDGLRYMNYYASGKGRITLETNYQYTNFEFITPPVNAWHSALLTVNLLSNEMKLWIDGSLAGNVISPSVLVDWGQVTGNILIGYIPSGLESIWIDELKIYHQIIIP
jgi:hypothetical protein